MLQVLTGTPPTRPKASSKKRVAGEGAGAVVGAGRKGQREGRWQGTRDVGEACKPGAGAAGVTFRRHAKGEDVLSTAATPVAPLELDPAHVATEDGTSQKDPFEAVAPATCAVCLLASAEAGDLLRCDTCHVHVHEHCWGRVQPSLDGSWRCDKCMESAGAGGQMAQCSLCPSAGGCLKKTAAGDWVHLQCALWIPELRFQEPEILEGISSTADVPRDRRLLTCTVCKFADTSAAQVAKKSKTSAGSSRLSTGDAHGGGGACIQCAKGGCFAAFHVTCAQLAGYHMMMMSGAEDDDEVPPLQAFCPKHKPQYMWKGHYVDTLKFLVPDDIVPLSLLLAKEMALSLVREILGGALGREGVEDWVADTVYEHWLAKRRRRRHFLSQHHVVRIQDLVAFLPGEWEQVPVFVRAFALKLAGLFSLSLVASRVLHARVSLYCLLR